MRDPFVEAQWQELCQHTLQCAKTLAGEDANKLTDFQAAAQTFSQQDPPRRYPELLQRTNAATQLALGWQESRTTDMPAGAPSNKPSPESTSVGQNR